MSNIERRSMENSLRSISSDIFPGPEKIEVTVGISPEYAEILTPEALQFVASLERLFRERRASLLARRVEIQDALDAGARPDFLPETRAIREGDWKVAPIPGDLLLRNRCAVWS